MSQNSDLFLSTNPATIDSLFSRSRPNTDSQSESTGGGRSGAVRRCRSAASLCRSVSPWMWERPGSKSSPGFVSWLLSDPRGRALFVFSFHSPLFLSFPFLPPPLMDGWMDEEERRLAWRVKHLFSLLITLSPFSHHSSFIYLFLLFPFPFLMISASFHRSFYFFSRVFVVFSSSSYLIHLRSLRVASHLFSSPHL